MWQIWANGVDVVGEEGAFAGRPQSDTHWAMSTPVVPFTIHELGHTTPATLPRRGTISHASAGHPPLPAAGSAEILCYRTTHEATHDT